MLLSNDNSAMVDPSQVLTGVVSDRHLHCKECLDEAGIGLCRLSLLPQRLETDCLNSIHIMFY